jgi:hypothetical protein
MLKFRVMGISQVAKFALTRAIDPDCSFLFWVYFVQIQLLVDFDRLGLSEGGCESIFKIVWLCILLPSYMCSLR